MDDLQKKIEEIKKKKEELNSEIEALNTKKIEINSTIHRNENEINNIIKKAIDNIVEDNINLEDFKKESLKKISEIIKNKKALIKKQEDIDTKEKEIYDKIKQYILLYIESEGIKENKVIYYYTEYNSGGHATYDIHNYIYYISTKNNIYRYMTENKINDNDNININVNEKTDVSETDLKKTYDSITKGDIKNIEEKIKNITINIKE
jgi:hypothetical protein